MNKGQITQLFSEWKPHKKRTLVVIDFANVVKWKQNTGWRIGISNLKNLIRNLSTDDKNLRRFYYGSDYGPKESSTTMTPWSESVISGAKQSNFKIITKRVKYIHKENGEEPEPKCDLDVEMTVDMISMHEKYDRLVLFSGDGDMAYALEYIRNAFGKEVYVFGARGHIGKELVDALQEGKIKQLFYANDFEYRLSMEDWH